jgi:hypothetical protein
MGSEIVAALQSEFPDVIVSDSQFDAVLNSQTTNKVAFAQAVVGVAEEMQHLDLEERLLALLSAIRGVAT